MQTHADQRKPLRSSQPASSSSSRMFSRQDDLKSSLPRSPHVIDRPSRRSAPHSDAAGRDRRVRSYPSPRFHHDFCRLAINAPGDSRARTSQVNHAGNLVPEEEGGGGGSGVYHAGGGVMLGGTDPRGFDPIHAPLIDQFRREEGFPPGGVDEFGNRVGPSDAEIKYGGHLIPCRLTSATTLHAPDGTTDTRTKLGPAEAVTLTSTMIVDWTASSGTPVSLGNTNRLVWTAPEAPGTTTIRATPRGAGRSCEKRFTTIAPNAITMTRNNVEHFAVGTSGAGMFTDMAFPPNDVSFSNIEMREVAGPASNVNGYFTTLQAAGVNLSHVPNPNFVRISANNAFSSDHASGSGFPAPFAVGNFDWVIPNNYRVVGSATERLFTDTTQAFSITAAGTVTITKAGATVTRTVNDVIT